MNNTYSFLDVVAAIIGPGGAVNIGADAGSDEGGISIRFVEDKNSMKTGADGNVMHVLHAGKAAKVTIRLLKTSDANGLLAALYNFQTTSSSNHGKNSIVVSDKSRGDIYTCQQVAFAKFPDNLYAKDANPVEWEFDVGVATPLLGIDV